MLLKKLLPAIKENLVSYSQGLQPNIALFGIRRGGSTLLADLLASEKGIWYANEPFALFPAHLKAKPSMGKYLPVRRHSQYFDLNKKEEEMLSFYLSELNQARIPIGTSRKTLFPLRANRVILKILNTPMLLDWISNNFGMQSIFLTRHPAAQAQSIIRLGWDFSTAAYLDNEKFMLNYIGAEEVKFGKKILEKGSKWEKAILCWVFENLFPLHHAKRLLLKLSYEELVLYPEKTLQNLCSTLALNNYEEMLKVINIPSGSSSFSLDSVKNQIRNKDKEQLINNWRTTITLDQKKSAQDILDAYNIKAYSFENSLPNQSFSTTATNPE